jgi:PAS domain S-box-containing protein
MSDTSDRLTSGSIPGKESNGSPPPGSALRESEARFRSVFESATDAIVLADRHGIITSWNRSAQAIFGYEEHEVLGKPLVILMPPRHRFRHEDGLARYRDGTSEGAVIGRTLELQGLRKDGTEFPIELSVAVWQTAAGPHFSGIIRDITQRKRAEEELTSSYEQLRVLSMRLETIREHERGSVAHAIQEELGQALSSLRIDIDWLGKRIASPHVSPHELKQRLVAMSSLIDTAIAQARRISSDLRPGVLDESGLVAALEWHARQFQERTLIRCRVADETRGTMIDPATSAQLFRITEECLANVARHSGAHVVDVSLRRENGRIVLEVKDDGSGIPQRVFQSPSSLGLLGVRERSRLMGGEARIETRPTGGASVIVSVPVAAGTTSAGKSGAERQVHEPGGSG